MQVIRFIIQLTDSGTGCCGSVLVFELILYQTVRYSQINIFTNKDKNVQANLNTNGIENRTVRQNLKMIGKDFQRFEIKQKPTEFLILFVSFEYSL